MTKEQFSSFERQEDLVIYHSKTFKKLKKFTKLFLYSRDTKENMEMFLSIFLGFDIEFIERYGVFDYWFHLKLDLGDKNLYLDIFYLIDRKGQLFITEISFESDHVLNSLDEDKKIIGVAQ